MKIKVRRSDSWLGEQRLQRGENVPQDIWVDIEPAELSMAARRIILDDYHGIYPDKWDGPGYCHGKGTAWAHKASSRILIDGHQVQPLELSAAIVRAALDRDRAREQHEAELAELDAEQARRNYKLKEAEAIMSPKLKELRGIIADKNRILEEYESGADTLLEVLRRLPPESLRRVAEEIAGEELDRYVDDVCKRINEAAGEDIV